MPLSRAQIGGFVCDLAENFGLPEPRISHRRRIRCRFGARTLHLGRVMMLDPPLSPGKTSARVAGVRRDDLAHELAHYFHKHFSFADGYRGGYAFARGFRISKGRGPLGRIHGEEWDRWRKLIGNYIAQEFGPGEGVTL